MALEKRQCTSCGNSFLATSDGTVTECVACWFGQVGEAVGKFIKEIELATERLKEIEND